MYVGARSVFARSILASNGGPLHEKLLGYTVPKTTALLEEGIDLSNWWVSGWGCDACAAASLWLAEAGACV